MTASPLLRPLNVLFTALIALQALFISEIALDLSIPSVLLDYRSGWLLAEFLGTAVLFVDMVVRFDELHPKRKGLYLAGIAACAVGWCFQFFVHYLDSALMS